MCILQVAWGSSDMMEMRGSAWKRADTEGGGTVIAGTNRRRERGS